MVSLLKPGNRPSGGGTARALRHVTNLTGRAKTLYAMFYCQRGATENLIKNMKRATRSDKTACHHWQANQFRLFLHRGAFWLLNALRQAAPRRSA